MADDHLTEAQLVTQLVAQTEVLLDGIKELLEATVPGLVAEVIRDNIHPSNRRSPPRDGSVTENLSSEGELSVLSADEKVGIEGGGQ